MTQRNTQSEAVRLDVHSPAFSHHETIPARHTDDGQNISPPLEWSGAPPETTELAVVMDDPDAPRDEPFAHWLVYHLPSSATRIAEGAGGTDGSSLPTGAVHGKNSFGSIGYSGPAPPPGYGHHYHFTVYALDARIGLASGAGRQELLKAINGHVLATGEIVGTYRRESTASMGRQ